MRYYGWTTFILEDNVCLESIVLLSSEDSIWKMCMYFATVLECTSFSLLSSGDNFEQRIFLGDKVYL